MWQDLLAALGLMLVLEGILPFVQPGQWRRAMLLATQFDDRTLRMVGFVSMLLGLIVVVLVR
ncbi:MAG: DUF2065 domain-containing protein [Gammaproteobacteria bacterium]|nr:DUF2065 domain-containing protein [Gammaproteobacteria bacterium]